MNVTSHVVYLVVVMAYHVTVMYFLHEHHQCASFGKVQGCVLIPAKAMFWELCRITLLL